VAAELAGRRARCKRCGEVFRISGKPSPEALPAKTSASAPTSDGPRYSRSDLAPAALGPAGGESFVGFRIVEDDDSGGSWEAPAKPRRPVVKATLAKDDREGPAASKSGWLPLPVQVAGLVVVLILAGWALSGLFSRAWTAAADLFGLQVAEQPAVGTEPDLEIPDVAPDRVDLVRQHAHMLMGLAAAYREMAQGYAAMGKPRSFEEGQARVASASARLSEVARQGQALPKLQPSEKVALGYIGNAQVVAALGQVVQEIGRLKKTPGLQGDFDRLETVMNRSLKLSLNDYPTNPGEPAIQLVFTHVADESHLQVFQQKARALADDPSRTSSARGFSEGTHRLKLRPILSARAYADRINFGKVVRVTGRRIEVNPEPPSAPELASLAAPKPAAHSEPRRDGALPGAPAQQQHEPAADAGPDPSQPAEIAIEALASAARLTDRPNPDGAERDRFREVAPPRGLLVGARVGYINAFGGSKVGAIRPIFQTAGSYVEGKPYGRDIPVSVTVVARPGYAVGAINTRTGLLLDAFQLVFMRFKDGKLDPSDNYLSSWLGDPRGGGSATVSGEGKFVIGVHGRSNGREINALGLVVAE